MKISVDVTAPSFALERPRFNKDLTSVGQAYYDYDTNYDERSC